MQLAGGTFQQKPNFFNDKKYLKFKNKKNSIKLLIKNYYFS